MLVDAAKHGDVEIPYFCYEPKLGPPVGACRMCLVEIEGIPKLQTSCSTPVKDGMVVITTSDRVKHAQERGGRVPAGQPPARLPGVRQGRRVPAAGHLLRLGRRQVALHRAQAPLPQAAGAVARWWRSTASAASSATAACASPRRWPRTTSWCSSSAATTPTSAPTTAAPTWARSAATSWSCARWARSPRPPTASARGPWDIEGAGSVCTLCPSQCNVTFTVRDDAKVLRVLARENAEVDDGWLCDKGRFGYQAIHSTERLRAPMVRDGGALREVSWERALDEAAGRADEGGRHGRARWPAAPPPTRRRFLLQHLLREALGSPAPGLARRRRARPRAGARAGAARPVRARERHRPRRRGAGGGDRAGGRGADPRPARAQGRAAQRHARW